jgi:hypothetical protein
VNPRLYAHAFLAARPRQVGGRLRRPLARRRFPDGAPTHRAAPVPAGEPLWRSPAFAPSGPPEAGTRLAGFHRHYGEDVLGAARAGELDRARSLLSGWIAANPPRNDDAWHPYPLATRIASWTAALTLEPALASPEFERSLWRQLLRLEANVEDDVLGNHVIRNARGLVAGGTTFAEPRFRRLGLELLRRELPEQVLPDGGHYERSPVYHLVVLRDLLEVRALTNAAWLAEPIERMRRFASALQRPDGAPALFNDGGLDLAPRLELDEPAAGVSAFPQTGYVVVRSPRLWLAFDCGPACPTFLPAHAHADALSLQVWWDGRPALVDTGTATYEPGPERDRLRSTAAHSTIALDGRSQFEPWRAFRSGPLPQVRLDLVEESVVVARVRWPGGLTHIRRVSWSPAEVVISDRVDGGGLHRITSRLVLAPGARALTAESAAGPVQVERGQVGERFGERLETEVLAVSCEAELPHELSWRIRPLE